jgi:pyruvate formate lyase activating enzyme
MLGCDLHCGYCQNWVTSQALRDPEATLDSRPASPEAMVQNALQLGARLIVSTYNEPLITSEWAVEVFRHAKVAGLATGYVSNGNGTPEVLDYIKPWVDLYKVDLKGFDDRRYRQLGGRLQPILDTIGTLHRAGIWVEIVTLLVPGFNDSEDELRDLTTFVAGVSPAIPWHVTAYHEDYRMSGTGNTTAAMLWRAIDIGRQAGLQYVYAGNMPGSVGDLETTKCASCGLALIERYGYLVQQYRLLPDGSCPSCRTPVPGRWSASFEGQGWARTIGRRLRVV